MIVVSGLTPRQWRVSANAQSDTNTCNVVRALTAQCLLSVVQSVWQSLSITFFACSSVTLVFRRSEGYPTIGVLNIEVEQLVCAFGTACTGILCVSQSLWHSSSHSLASLLHNNNIETGFPLLCIGALHR